MFETFVIVGSVIYASLFGLMALGLTLTYLTTKVPNFAYGSFVTVGMYVSYSLNKLYHVGIYESIPASFLIGAATSVAMYLVVLRPLARRGSSLVSIMIATLAVDIAFLGIFGMYTDYLSSHFGLGQTKIIFQFPDFDMLGFPGLLYVAPISLGLISSALFLLLTRTRFGISMRAAVENPNLAKILGINVEKVYVFAWLLAGGFAAMSGSLYVLWLAGGVSAGSGLIVEIFAASVLGGLASIYGAVLGGLIVGASEVIVTIWVEQLVGQWFSLYQKGVPLIMLIVTLLVLPQGLVSLRAVKLRLPRFFSKLKTLIPIDRLRRR